MVIGGGLKLRKTSRIRTDLVAEENRPRCRIMWLSRAFENQRTGVKVDMRFCASNSGRFLLPEEHSASILETESVPPCCFHNSTLAPSMVRKVCKDTGEAGWQAIEENTRAVLWVLGQQESITRASCTGAFEGGWSQSMVVCVVSRSRCEGSNPLPGASEKFRGEPNLKTNLSTRS